MMRKHSLNTKYLRDHLIKKNQNFGIQGRYHSLTLDHMNQITQDNLMNQLRDISYSTFNQKESLVGKEDQLRIIHIVYRNDIGKIRSITPPINILTGKRQSILRNSQTSQMQERKRRISKILLEIVNQRNVS